MNIPPLLLDRHAISVEFNGISYPPNSSLFAALYCVQPLYLQYPEYPDTPIAAVGSLLKVCQDGRYYVFFTRHQVGEHDPKLVSLECQKKGHWVTGHRLVHDLYSRDDPRSSDLCMVEFTDLVRSNRLSSTGWLRLLKDYRIDQMFGCIVLGYPSSENRLYENDSDILQKCTAAQGELVQKQDGLALYSVKLDRRLKCDPDGFSGGVVLLLIRSGDRIRLIPGGTIIGANYERMNFIHAREYQGYMNYSS